MRLLIGCGAVTSSPWVVAEWSATAHGTMFYTDDVGVFSATRRLSLDGDPTQPALDNRLTGQGSDAVFEPMLDVARSFANNYGTTTVDLRGQGFVYFDQSRYSHGTLRVQAQQAFSRKTALLFRYYYAPDLYLGENEVRTPGLLAEPGEAPLPETAAEHLELSAERVTSQIGMLRVKQELTEGVALRLLGRYGTRRYNAEFQQRDLNFWTLGPHVEWDLTDAVTLVIGYHYEKGTADGATQPLLADDVSYVNNYASTELEVEFAEDFKLIAGLHFERNDWTSTLMRDERKGAFETVWQGEALLLYQLNERTKLYGGVQHSNRSENIRAGSVPNTNVALGLQASF
ncbi:MAG: hypothetical protein FJ189_07420 [Gammaproteobacteria bacterium]|nr:hypothetical protein [Gammaproteobacteria bacterium]